MNLYIIPSLIGVIINAPLIAYILYKDTRKRDNQVFALLTFGILIWSIGEVFLISAEDPYTAMFWVKFAWYGISLVGPTFLHFMLQFQESPILKRKLAYLMIYLPGLISIYLVWSGMMFTGLQETYWARYYNAYSIFYTIFITYIEGALISGLYFSWKAYRKGNTPMEKSQAKYIFLATSIPIAGGSITNAILPVFGIFLLPLACFFSSIMALIIAYDMKRYRLMTPKSFSIFRKLITGFLFITTLTIFVGYISFESSHASLEYSIGSDSAAIAESIMYKIEDDIYGRMDNFREFSQENQLLKETLVKSNAEFDGMGSRIMDYIQEKDSEWISAPREEITPFMKALIENGLSEDLRKKEEFYMSYSSRVYGEVSVANKYGVNIAQTEKTNDYYQADEEWWQAAREKGFYLSDVEYDNSSGVYSITGAIGIFDGNGNFSGAMKIVLNLEEIISIIKEAKSTSKYKTAEIMLLDGKGRVIHDTSGRMPFLGNAAEELSQLQDNKSYVIMRNPDGKEKLVSYSMSHGQGDFAGLGWILIADYDSEEVLAPITNLRNTVIISILFAIALAIVSVFLIHRSIARPLINLKNKAVEIGKGNLDVKVEYISNDEIGELAAAFNKMAEDLKEFEAQIKGHTEELETKVKERTFQLDEKVNELEGSRTAILNMMEDAEEANRQLRIAQEELNKAMNKLKEIDAKKDEFISITAHEFKTPLTAIRGFSELLQNETDKESRSKYIKIMIDETMRLSKLVNDILDLSRIDLGTFKFNFEEVDIREVVESIKSEMKIPIAQKGLKAKYSISADVPRKVATDTERLKQILINLLTNAVKYTPKGSIELKIAKEGSSLHFSVKDTGIGISKENIPKLFHRFYQIDSSYTRNQKGSGLGLVICKEILEGMGGKIWLESELGKGSTFHFTLLLSLSPNLQKRQQEKQKQLFKSTKP